MITLSNYQEKVKPSQLNTPALKQGHEFMTDFADLYGEDPDITQAIDNHLKAVNDLIASSSNIHVVKPTLDKPAKKVAKKTAKKKPSGSTTKKKVTPAPKTMNKPEPLQNLLKDAQSGKEVTDRVNAAFAALENKLGAEWWENEPHISYLLKATEAEQVQYLIDLDKPKKKTTTSATTKKKVAGSKKPKKAKAKKEPAIRKKELIRTFDDEVTIIKRFFRLIRKNTEVRSFVLLHRFIQKLLADKKVHGNSKFADLVTTIANKTSEVVEKSKGITSDKVYVDVKDNFHSQVENIANRQAVYPSVRLFKRFIGVQGEVPSQKKLTGLIDAIEKAFAAKRVMGTDPFADELKAALETLKEAKKEGSIKPMQIGLSGSGGLGEVAAYLGMPFEKK